jgi:hypothetical protein
MPTIRLGDADRERFGCAEWLDLPETLPVKDARALEEAGGKYLEYFQPETARGFQTLVWHALHRAGIPLKLSDMEDLDLRAILLADAAPGKAPSSGNGSGRTRRTSASSSTARRRTSKTSS